MKIYIASSFSLIDKIEETVGILEEEGHEITVKWWLRRELKDKFANLSPDEFYAEPECEYAYNRDIQGIRDCDALLLIADDEPRYYTGANIEVGIAYALDKPVFCIGALRNSAMYKGVKRLNSVEEFLEYV